METDTLPYQPYGKPLPPEPPEENCNQCKIYWLGKDLGNNREHTDYVLRKFPKKNVGVLVIAPDGTGAEFDAAEPSPNPEFVYELKTRRSWALRDLNELGFGNIKTLGKDLRQFGKDANVAFKCGLAFQIWFKEQRAWAGYGKKFPWWRPIMFYKPIDDMRQWENNGYTPPRGYTPLEN